MKKTSTTAITGILLLLLTSMQPQPKPTTVSKEEKCGPSFVITNPAGYTVTKINVQVQAATNYQYDIINPTFPYSFSDPGLGSYTFIFYFSGTASGSINVTDWNSNFITCESFETPYLSPFSFYAGCFTHYYLVIRNWGC